VKDNLKETPVKEKPEREERPSFLAEHDYFAAPLVQPPDKEKSNDLDVDTDGTESAEEDGNTTPLEVFIDHNYCLPPKPFHFHFVYFLNLLSFHSILSLVIIFQKAFFFQSF
jgi:hypothetical protein